MKYAKLGAVCAALLAMSGPAFAGSYTFTGLTFPGNGAPIVGSGTTGINSANQIAGSFLGSDQHMHGFIWSAGTVTQVDFGIGGDTMLSAINDSGLSAGWSCSDCTNGPATAFTYNLATGAFRTLSVKPSRYVTVSAIDAAGDVVGTSGDRKIESFITDSSNRTTKINFPGHNKITDATGIDGTGAVVGYYAVKRLRNMGFSYKDGVFTTFNPPRSNTVQSVNVTAAGEMSGTYNQKKGPFFGFTYSGGTYTLYSNSDNTVTGLAGVTDAGVVIGQWVDQKNHLHGWVNVAGKYYPISYPGATDTRVFAVNGNGSMVGVYNKGSVIAAYFVGVCPTGQAPCTQ
jgi:hypothetical protein